MAVSLELASPAKNHTRLEELHDRHRPFRATERLEKVRDDMDIRAQRGRPEDLRDILAQVHDAPPVPGDEL